MVKLQYGRMGIIVLTHVCHECNDVNVTLSCKKDMQDMSCKKCDTNNVAVYASVMDSVDIFD